MFTYFCSSFVEIHMTLCHRVVNKIPFCCQDPINKVSKEKKFTRTFTDYFTKKLYKSIFDIFTLWLVLSAITTFEIEAPYNCVHSMDCFAIIYEISAAAPRNVRTFKIRIPNMSLSNINSTHNFGSYMVARPHLLF